MLPNPAPNRSGPAHLTLPITISKGPEPETGPTAETESEPEPEHQIRTVELGQQAWPKVNPCCYTFAWEREGEGV